MDSARRQPGTTLKRRAGIGAIAAAVLVVTLVGVRQLRLDPWRPGTTHAGRAVPTYCGTFVPDPDVLRRGEGGAALSIPWVLDEQLVKAGTASAAGSIVPRDGTLTVTEDGRGVFVADDGTQLRFRHSFCPTAHHGS